MTGTLTARYPKYNIDWKKVCEPKFMRRIKQSHPRDKSRHIQGALQEVMDRVLGLRAPWAWCANSCHMDTWLMVELAFWCAVAGDEDFGHRMTDEFILGQPALSRLFRVLLRAGLPDQDTVKMAYWVREIDFHSIAHNTFGRFLDYSCHQDYLHGVLKGKGRRVAPGGLDIAGVTTVVKPQCSNPHHRTPIPCKETTGDLVYVRSSWFNLPDQLARTMDENGRWHCDRVHAEHHKDLSDVLQSQVSRTDGETTACPACSADGAIGNVLTHRKVPERALFPLSLSFDVDPRQKMDAEWVLVIGGLLYDLVGVVFGNGTHFKCNVTLAGSWYQYDGIGMPNFSGPPDPDSPYPVKPRLVRMDPQEAFMVPPPPSEGFVPVSYRYLRAKEDTLEPVPPSNPESMSRETQFNAMRLLA